MLIDPTPASGIIIVTCVYFFFWYYLLLGKQRGTKARLAKEYAARGQKFDRYFGQDPEMLAVDRVVTNTHEQMTPFLVSMWLFGVIVSPLYAAILGGVYIALRAIYPFLLGKRVSMINTKLVAFVTFPCYGIIFAFLIGTLLRILEFV